MCKICVTAEQELSQFLDQLVENHPGTEVEGLSVEKDHHMISAVIGQTIKRLQSKDQLILAELLLAKNNIYIAGTVDPRQLSASPTGGLLAGGDKVIDA